MIPDTKVKLHQQQVVVRGIQLIMQSIIIDVQLLQLLKTQITLLIQHSILIYLNIQNTSVHNPQL
jgi:hypothetical protein